jgi:hypothetical protein
MKGTRGINDTGGKFAANVNYTGGMTPAANLPPVSTTLAANGILRGLEKTDS